MTPSTGSTTAVSKKPIMAGVVAEPAFWLKNGGEIRLPAPKKRENSIKMIVTICFLSVS